VLILEEAVRRGGIPLSMLPARRSTARTPPADSEEAPMRALSPYGADKAAVNFMLMRAQNICPANGRLEVL